jgi:hypothetical protein
VCVVTVDGLLKIVPLLLACKGKKLAHDNFFCLRDVGLYGSGGFQEDMKGYTVSQF